ncbi:hypothetical protein DQ04_02831020 [Trypanosoma grayi]|uniref:hypothetical protein n=1 Tax=Trypanosoma grayi TaxID=71804 RepID=UPI0004F4A676|nr:hypothetical protein DQ04_02831020 [Trypanosoma grayi]KEG11233.1 hypothetical protein DQ04_02831020 [Trypanosoma grayi]
MQLKAWWGGARSRRWLLPLIPVLLVLVTLIFTCVLYFPGITLTIGCVSQTFCLPEGAGTLEASSTDSKYVTACDEMEAVLFPPAAAGAQKPTVTLQRDTIVIFIGDSTARHAFWRTLNDTERCAEPSAADQMLREALTSSIHDGIFLKDYHWPISKERGVARLHMVYLVKRHIPRLPDLLRSVTGIVARLNSGVSAVSPHRRRESHVLLSVHMGAWDVVRPNAELDGHNFTYIDWLQPPPRLPLPLDPALRPLHELTQAQLLERFRGILADKVIGLREVLTTMAQSNARRQSMLTSATTATTAPLFLPQAYRILFVYPVRVNCSAERFSPRRKNEHYRLLSGATRCRRMLHPAWRVVHDVLEDEVTTAMTSSAHAASGGIGMIRALDSDKFLIIDPHVVINEKDATRRKSGFCTLSDGVHFDANATVGLTHCGAALQKKWWGAMSVS